MTRLCTVYKRRIKINEIVEITKSLYFWLSWQRFPHLSLNVAWGFPWFTPLVLVTLSFRAKLFKNEPRLTRRTCWALFAFSFQVEPDWVEICIWLEWMGVWNCGQSVAGSFHSTGNDFGIRSTFNQKNLHPEKSMKTFKQACWASRWQLHRHQLYIKSQRRTLWSKISQTYDVENPQKEERLINLTKQSFDWINLKKPIVEW